MPWLHHGLPITTLAWTEELLADRAAYEEDIDLYVNLLKRSAPYAMMSSISSLRISAAYSSGMPESVTTMSKSERSAK